MSLATNAALVLTDDRRAVVEATSALPAFAALGDADAVGRHYARLYVAYRTAQDDTSASCAA